MDEDLNLFNEYLIRYEGAIYDNYEVWASYLENEAGMRYKYSPIDWCANVSFSAGGVEFVWVEHTGQHVCSVMEWEEFKRYLKYLEKRMASVNEITGDRMHSGVPSEAFKKGYDAIDWSRNSTEKVKPKDTVSRADPVVNPNLFLTVDVMNTEVVQEALQSLEILRADSKRLDFIFKYEVKFKRGFDFPCRIEYYGKGGDTAVEANTMRECIDIAIEMEQRNG